jgi:Skp family chaperone for outer membrane proteins
MKLLNIQTWTRAVLLAVPVAVTQVALTQMQSEFGFVSMSTAFAQEEGAPKKQQETRRTPALRNKVYEKLSEAQVAAEQKDW